MKAIKFLIVIVLLAVLSAVPQSAASLSTTRAVSEVASRAVAEGMPPTGATTPQDAPTVVAELTQERDPELSKIFRKYDVLKLDPAIAASQIRRTGKLLLGTSAGQFDLKVAPHDIRSADYVAQVIGSDGIGQKLARTPVNTFKGEVRGLPQAQVRLTIEQDSIEGSIITKSERYFIQPARALSRASRSDEFVFYRGSDVIKDAGECGVTLADEVAAEEERAQSTAGSGSKSSASNFETSEITSLSPLKIVRLVTDADAEYVAALGGVAQANNQIVNIMNQVDGIYQVEIGVTFQIVGQNAWTDAATDPYTSTAVSGTTTLLGEFSNRWNSNPPILPSTTPRDLAHLWTGKDLDGLTIGVAFVGVVCVSAASSYGLSQRINNSASTVVLTAHEIGHNFSARHTNVVTSEMPPDTNTPCDNTIMEASVGSGMNFCPMSRSQIIGHANANATCLQASGSGPGFPSCVETPIDGSLSAAGMLTNTDCRAPSRGVGFFADRYSFQGTAGQRLTITMNDSGVGLDSYLYLIGPSGFVISQDDDGGDVGDDSKISASGTFTLPDSGKYIIEATSFSTGDTGNYTVNVTPAGCTLSASPSSQHFPAAGGNGTVNVTATGGGCSASYQFTNSPATATWLVPQTGSGTGSQALNFTVDPNTGSAGRRAFIVVGSSIVSGSSLSDTTGGLLIPITQSGTGPDCSLTPISFGQTVGGTLTTSSCQSPIRGNNFYAARYSFTASAGQQIAVSMSATGADPFISLVGPNGVVLLTDDDSGGGTNSRLPGGQGFLTLGLPGTYIIEASFCGPSPSGCAPNQTGSYSLTLTGSAIPAPTIFVEQGTANVAAAVDSVTQVKGPFTVLTPNNFSQDGRRRIIFFTSDLGLAAGNTTGLIVRANTTSLPVETAGPFSLINGSYVIIRLDTLTPGPYNLTVELNGANSTNAPTIQIIF